MNSSISQASKANWCLGATNNFVEMVDPIPHHELLDMDIHIKKQDHLKIHGSELRKQNL